MALKWKRFVVLIIFLVTIFCVIAVNFYRSLEETQTFTTELTNYQTRILMLQEENELLSSKLQKEQSIIPQHEDAVSIRSSGMMAETVQRLNNGREPTQDIHIDNLPSLKAEKLRRRISNQLQEMWFYISNQVKFLAESPSRPNKTKLRDMLRFYKEINQITQLDFEEFISINGAQSARDKLAVDLSDKVQRRLHDLQHPSDCNSAKKLKCSLNKSCGYGCQMHHILYCFIVAYYTKRTMILDSMDWDYSQVGWEEYFLPLSSNCVTSSDGVEWGFDHEKHQVVILPIVDELMPAPEGMPLSVPRDLYQIIPLFHGQPFVWWIGQFCKYLFRFQSKLREEIATKGRMLGFRKPIVGIHIRRTDKIDYEANSHPAEEYMYWVNLYFKKLSRKQEVKVRRVYVSTDDQRVVRYLIKKYPHYTFVHNYNASKYASVHRRFSDESLHGVISDIEFLSDSDYLICTFSSQFCRLAYEIMNNKHTDASQFFHSLDDVYYFGGQREHRMQAIWPHLPKYKSEVSLEVGDIVGIAGNHWNGWGKGKHHRSGISGLFPAYKMEDLHDVVDFPSYED